MSDAPSVQRDIDVGLEPGELWPLIGDGQGWAEWLVEESDVAVEPGCEGTVVDGGTRRGVRVEEVEPGQRVTWSWWPTDHPDEVSTVRLVVVSSPRGSRIHISETRTLAMGRWSVRAWRLASFGLAAVA
jgi:hypothetical protein